MCVCVCVCIFCIVTLDPLSTLCVSFFVACLFFLLIYIFIADNISISHVQRFEPQGRRFTKLLLLWSPLNAQHPAPLG